MKKIIIFLSTLLFALTPKEYLKVGTDEAIYNAANEYYKMGKYKKAIELYKQVHKSNLKFRALYNLGNAYAKSFDFQNAIKAYKKALQIKKDKDALYNLKLIEKILKKQKLKDNNSNTNKQKKQASKNSNQNKQKNISNKKKNLKTSNKNNKSNKTNTKKSKKQQKITKSNQKSSPHNEKLNKFKIIKESNTTDIRKRFYMNKLKELKFNTLLLPLRSTE